MFGFGKKKKKNIVPENSDEQPKKKTRADKIVMGAILGVAIGSVISVSLMPKKKEKNEKGVRPPAPKKKGFFGLFKKKKSMPEAGIADSPRKIPTEFE